MSFLRHLPRWRLGAALALSLSGSAALWLAAGHVPFPVRLALSLFH